ncbi:MAG: tetratricopeptide repeat protein [Opitutales bacterium]
MSRKSAVISVSALLILWVLYSSGFLSNTFSFAQSRFRLVFLEGSYQRDEYIDALFGDPSAQNSIGVYFSEGSFYFEPNEDEAFRWFKKAAAGGDVFGTSNTGVRYYNGWGVEKDLEQAFIYFEKAAKMGNPYATMRTAEMYALGEYVSQDYEKALEWFQKAVATKDTLAYNNTAWFLSTVEDDALIQPELAIRLMEELVIIEPEHNHTDTLAAAYASNGEFEKAISTMEQAIAEGKVEGASEETLRDYQDRKELYESGKRFILVR